MTLFYISTLACSPKQQESALNLRLLNTFYQKNRLQMFHGTLFWASETLCLLRSRWLSPFMRGKQSASAAKPGRIRHKACRIPALVPLRDTCFQQGSSTACTEAPRDFQETQKILEKGWVAHLLHPSTALPFSAALVEPFLCSGCHFRYV